MLTERTFDTGAVTIHYADGPAGAMPLVLLHGATQRWQHFLPVLPLLAECYHIYAIDLRGHGRSGWTTGAYHIEDFAGDIARFLQECVAEPAVLLGYSLGGAIAFHVAASAPDRIRALILAEPSVHIFGQERAKGEPMFQAFGEIGDLLKTKPSQQEIFEMERNPEEDSVTGRFKAKSLKCIDPDVFTHLAEHRFEEYFRPEEAARQITCPVLLLQGDPALGAIVKDQDVERVHALLANCTHVRLAGAGHNLHTPRPLEFYRLVSYFLESI